MFNRFINQCNIAHFHQAMNAIIKKKKFENIYRGSVSALQGNQQHQRAIPSFLRCL